MFKCLWRFWSSQFNSFNGSNHNVVNSSVYDSKDLASELDKKNLELENKDLIIKNKDLEIKNLQLQILLLEERLKNKADEYPSV